MRILRSLAKSVACVTVLFASTVPADTSSADAPDARMAQVFKERMTAIEAAEQQSGTEILKRYKQTLEGQRAAAQQAGDLAAVLALQMEQQRVKEEQSIPAVPEADTHDSVAAIISQMAPYMQAMRRNRLTDEIALTLRYADALDRMTKSLVREGRMEEAVKVKITHDGVKAQVEFVRDELAALPQPTTASADDGRADERTGRTVFTFEGNDLTRISRSGSGQLVEENGRLKADSYGSSTGAVKSHGPRGEASVSMLGDFELTAKVNFDSAGAEMGNMICGVLLSNGQTLAFCIGDSHTDFVEHGISLYTEGNKAITPFTTGMIRRNPAFREHPITITRSKDSVILSSGGTELHRSRGVSRAGVSKIFVEFNQYGSYPPLSELAVTEITMGPVTDAPRR